MDSARNVSHSTELLDENLKGNSFESKLRCLDDHDNKAKAVNDRTLQTVNLKASHQKLVDRVKLFLPKIDSANKMLAMDLANNKAAQDKYDIEKTDDCNEVVEMDIALVPNLEQTALQQLLDEIGSDSSSDDDDNETEVTISIAKENKLK